MDGYSWIALLTLIVTVVAVWMIRKRKEYKYSMLDTSGIILNAVLIVMIYPPLSVVGALFEIGQFATEPLSIFFGGRNHCHGQVNAGDFRCGHRRIRHSSPKRETGFELSGAIRRWSMVLHYDGLCKTQRKLLIIYNKKNRTIQVRFFFLGDKRL
jgi:ACR3 family arsenite efflux pump ArsB